jgi:hypothetical protein
MHSLKTINEQSSSVLSNINTALSQITSVSNGLYKDNSTALFIFDLADLAQNPLSDLLTSYQVKYKTARQKAAIYISDSVSQLTDLFFKMATSPNSFDDLLLAHKFYLGISALLDRCILSTDLASAYLTEALQLETAYGDMITFYMETSSSTANNSCDFVLEQHVDMFSTVALVLAHVHYQVNHWLQNNENMAFYLGAQKIRMLDTLAYNGTITEPTVSTMTTVSIMEAVTITNTTYNNTIPGIKLLVDCPSCFSIIVEVEEVLKSSDRASSCMSEYEDVLIGTLAAINSKLVAPVFSGSVPLYAALDQFESFSEDLSRIKHEYLTGNISGAACATAATSTLQNMALRVQTITDEVKTSVNTFVNTVNDTCLAWNASYNAILHNMTDLLPLYIANTTELYAALSQQDIWFRPYCQWTEFLDFNYQCYRSSV